jgi:hypothetical protein
MFDLKATIETLMEDAEGMLVTVGKKVMPLSDAPPVVQIRWLKNRVQELEGVHAPKKK